MKKRLLSLLAVVCLLLSVLSMGALAAEPASFCDLPAKGSWSYDALVSAVESGLLQGDGGYLNPKGNLTRAQLAAVLNRAFGAQTKADISGFSDVSATAWYAADIAKAVQMGTFQGGGSAMRPNDPVTRQETFTVLARAFKLADGDSTALNSFSDKASVAAYAKGPLAVMVQAGYLKGMDNALQPNAPVTREQLAQVLYQMLSATIDAAGTYTQDYTGNVMVKAPSVTLQNLTVTGDLILGEGVGDGEVTLDGVTVTGRLVIRGGGEHSIILKNKTNVGSIIVGKTGDGGVRLRTEEGCIVDVVYVADGKDDVILEGSFNQVQLTTDTPVVLNDATITGLTVIAPQATVTAGGKTNISVVQIDEAAKGAALTVDSGAKVAKVESAAPSVTISGSGTVNQAAISGDNTAVNTSGTKVTAEAGATGVTQNGTAVKPATPPSTSGGSTTKPTQTEIAVTTSEQLVAAIKNTQYQKIWLGSRESTADSSFTIPASAGALEMGAGRELYVMCNSYGNPTKLTIEVGATLKVAYLFTEGYVQNLGTLDSTVRVEIGEGGVLENRGTLSLGTISDLQPLVNNGDLVNAGDIQNEPDFGEDDQTAMAFWGSRMDYTPAASLTATVQPNTAGILLTESETLTANAAVTDAAFIPMGVSLTVPAGKTLSVGPEATFFVAGTLDVAGNLTVNDNSALFIICGTEHVENQVNNGSLFNAGALTNSSYIQVRHGALVNVGTLENTENRSFIEVSGLLLNQEGGTVHANDGSIAYGPQGGNIFGLEENFNIGQAYRAVSTEVALRQAMADGAAAELAADVTVTDDLDITRPLAVWNDGETSDEGFTLTIAENATVTLKNGAGLTLFGNFINYGQFINAADSDGIVLGDKTVFTNNGVFDNCNHLGVFEGSFTNSGTLHNGDGSDARIVLVGATLNNTKTGTVNNKADIDGFVSDDETAQQPGIENAGTFNNGLTGNGSAHLSLRGGSLSNTGHIVNNGYMDLFDVDVTHSGDGATFDTYNSSGFVLTGGSFDTTGADDGSFNNEGYMKIIDRYGNENQICTKLPDDAVFDNDSDWLDYTAEVYSEAGLTAAEQSDKDYNRLDFAGSFTIGTHTLSTFREYWIISAWNDEMQAEKPVTLTVEAGETLTVAKQTTLHVEGGELVVGGTLVTEAPDDTGDNYIDGGSVEIWPNGSFDASIEAVKNNGAFWVRYIEGGDGEFGRDGSVSGAPEDTQYLAIVHTAEGMDAALTSTDPTFDRIEIKDNSNFTLLESTTEITVPMYVEPGSGFTVPYGVSLTLDGMDKGGNLWNDGDITVWGNLILSNYDLDNQNNLTIGAVSGSEQASVVLRDARLTNNGNLTIYHTGTLDTENGRYEGIPANG